MGMGRLLGSNDVDGRRYRPGNDRKIQVFEKLQFYSGNVVGETFQVSRSTDARAL
jgi:hypothetical protein